MLIGDAAGWVSPATGGGIRLAFQWGRRAAAVAAVLGGVALLYFVVLAACGLRPRHLLRRA